MSKENRPNLHAVGFILDITESLEKRIRGKAGEAGIEKVFPQVREKVLAFVEDVDYILDKEFGE